MGLSPDVSRAGSGRSLNASHAPKDQADVLSRSGILSSIGPNARPWLVSVISPILGANGVSVGASGRLIAPARRHYSGPATAAGRRRLPRLRPYVAATGTYQGAAGLRSPPARPDPPHRG